MASEITIARESSVNPINAMGGNRRTSPITPVYNAYTGDNIYDISYTGYSGYPEKDSVRIRAKADSDGYRITTLPDSSNQTVMSAAREIINSESKLKVDIEAGDGRSEMRARSLGFEPDKNPTRDEFSGMYWRTWRKK